MFGLTVDSSIPLPELESVSGLAAPDVSITRGPVPRLIEPEPQGLSVSSDGATLNIVGVARYWIRGGASIVFEPDPEASDRNIRLFLLGSAFGALLHQRGALPLHANAIEIDGRAVAFMGHSGAGKSTLAAWFHDRGYKVLADDVCVVAPGLKALAHPGIPRLRLCTDALEFTGRSGADYEPAFDDHQKFNVPTTSRASQAPLELSHAYLLARGESPSVSELRGVEALEAVVANTYRGHYATMMGQTGRHIFQCISLLQSVPLFEARRAWGIGEFCSQAGSLEAHARSLIASKRLD